jgi:hypothetical protein
MGVVDLSLKGIGELMTGAGTLAKDIRSAITGDITAEKKAELELKLLELENTSMNAQLEVNKTEAASANIFVAGWRPFIGWTCGLALFYNYLVRPLVNGLSALELPVLDMTELYPLILGMLGIAGMRTAEKFRGVARK